MPGSSGGAPRLADLTVVVVNFRTLGHTRSCVESVRTAYPSIRLLVVDNGSADESTDYLRELARRDPQTEVILNEANRFHGPALHQGMEGVQTSHAFLLDSDCEFLSGDFLEPLLERFAANPLLYAIGKRGWTNRHGHAPVDRRQPHTAYIHPFACMLDRAKYFTLPPFEHHGAPLWRNMWGARRAGFQLEHVPIEDFVLHHGKVTASVHGYGYDLRLRTQATLNRLETRTRRAAARLRGRELQPPELPPARSA